MSSMIMETPRYERLQSQEGSFDETSSCPDESDPPHEEPSHVEVDAVPPGIMPNESPPPYNAEGTGPESCVETYSHETPPQYSEVVKLPSYEEAETARRVDQLQRYFGFINMDDDLSDNEARLGSDFGFILCFILAFLMNWVGFIVGYCFTNTIASHYGALSGFGLSLVKWTFIIRHADCCRNYFSEQPWLMWLFAIFGWLIFIRGVIAYLQIKRLSNVDGCVRIWGWNI